MRWDLIIFQYFILVGSVKSAILDTEYLFEFVIHKIARGHDSSLLGLLLTQHK